MELMLVSVCRCSGERGCLCAFLVYNMCNVVTKLSKCMDKATMDTYLEMVEVIKFVIATKNFGLRVQLERKHKNCSLLVFCDCDWEGDYETRNSVNGFIVYLMDVPVCWQSKFKEESHFQAL
jgi:hypothetical protein